MTLRIGSLCTGYGGLDEGLRAVVDGHVAWCAENDPDAARIVAARYPGVPNHGDITSIRWTPDCEGCSQPTVVVHGTSPCYACHRCERLWPASYYEHPVDPVDLVCAGFPCQDLSHAGRRAGMRPGTRSGLWFHIAYGISVLRPSWVLLENVRGLLSGRADRQGDDDDGGADRDLESAGADVGAPNGDPVRALGVVLGDLADLGYDARWVGLPAAAAGAPHGRFRVFILAASADAEPLPLRQHGEPGRVARAASGGAGTDRDATRAGAVGGGVELCGRRTAGAGRGRSDAAAPDAGSGGFGAGTGLCAGEPRGLGRGRPGDDDGEAPADAERGGRAGRAPEPQRRPVGGTTARGSGEGGSGGCAAPDAEDQPGSHVAQGADTTALECAGPRTGVGTCEGGAPAGTDGLVGGSGVEWGPYASAIRRWERVTGRPVPHPTERTGRGQRLAPAFSEWMMGLSAGWVTDVPIHRNAQLRALGNGVVPQQAELAVRTLIRGWSEATA